MKSSKRVGLFLKNVKERETLRAAAKQCGLEPEVLDWAGYKAALGENPDAVEAAKAAGIALEFIVTDEVLIAGKAGERGAAQRSESQGFANWQAPPLVLVRDSVPARKGKMAGQRSESAAGEVPESDDAEGCDGCYEWVLERPLGVASVASQLRQFAHANRVFERRHYGMHDEVKRARKIFNSVSNGVTLSDATQPDMPLVYVNRAFERMTGYAAMEVTGRNCRFLQGTDHDQPGLDTLREAIRHERDVRVLLKNYRKDGTAFWNELYMSPIFDHGGHLTHFAGIQNDVTRQVESQMELNHLATHDAMTGLANRSLLLEQMKRALERARRNGKNIAVLFFDLNDFKEVNDVFGHAAGDELLKVVAQRLRKAMRASETVARLGGDEFVAVLEEEIGTDWAPEEAMLRLRARVGEPIGLFDQKFHPSASVGMALYPRDGETPEALLKVADFNMYVAKHGARSAAEQEEEPGKGEDRSLQQGPGMGDGFRTQAVESGAAGSGKVASARAGSVKRGRARAE
jgi:diguanylate cyclase (GGDEF)-like protein/PAS domain S-box-containing protein